MKRLVSNITIGKYNFGFVTNVSVESSRETFTDTATIELPNRLYKSQDGSLTSITDKIKINDTVTIQVGYHPLYNTVFTGYVSNVTPDSPCIIKCEDESFKLKQKTVGPVSLNNTTIKELIESVYDGETDIKDAEIGDIRIDQYATLVNVLDDLRSRFGIRSYFRDGVLTVFNELESSGTDRNLHFQRNIIEHSLEFQNTDALNVISHGVSTQLDGTKIERYAYYLDGEIKLTSTQPPGVLNTFSWPKLTQAALDELISKRLPRLYWSGIVGNLTTFGSPLFLHGDNAVLGDYIYSERKGRYKSKSVNTTFGQGGYRQTIELDLKLTDN